MKRKVLGILAVLAIMSLTACGNKPEVEPIPETNNNEVIENVVEVPERDEREIAKESLIEGGEWKPTTGFAKENESGEIIEYTAETIYGKYAGVGGATFHEDGTFTKFVGVFEAEEVADKTGTYSINTDDHTITFNYSRGEVVTMEYGYSDEGKVMYFNYPEENFIVRFDPTNSISLKDNNEEAKYQIELAMKNQIKEMFGNDVVDSKVFIQKIYTPADEQEVEPLKEMNLGKNEVAFEVKYELKPAEGVDVMSLTAATGEYDEESGWVKEKYNLGILRPNDSGDAKYKITDFGTGW
ncbi:MAG: hypothetical protein IJ220_01895 [Clostridia bacterium]|nr:hypothetical protein [Clostridia bacterium]